MKFRLIALIAVAVLAAGVVAIVVATSGASTSHALYSYGGWGAGTPKEPVGKRLSMTDIPLCVRGTRPVTLESITPVRVVGSVRFDRMLVMRGVYDKLAFYDGTPPHARPVAGFVIPPMPSCNVPHTGGYRYVAVAVAHATGPRGGAINGFRVRYRAGGATGEYTIDATYGLCGPRPGSACSGP